MMSFHWRDEVVAVIDTETTGLDKSIEQIVQVAAILWRPRTNEVIDYCEWLVRPFQPIPASASEVHHITNEMVANAPRFETVGVELAAFLEQHRVEVCAAYNRAYDHGMLLAEYLRAGLPAPYWLQSSMPWVDPLTWVRMVEPNVRRKGAYKLTSVAERWGCPLAENEAHSALGDSRATLAILNRLSQHVGQDALLTLPEDVSSLIRVQSYYAAVQELEYQEWAVRQPIKTARHRYHSPPQAA